MGGNMKVHQYEFPRGMLIRSSWDQQSQLIEASAAAASLSSFCHTTATSSSSNSNSNSNTAFRFDLKSFIKPHHCGSNETNVSSSDDKLQVETSTHPGGTRWNPTLEQIGILEKLYREGMRTPNSQQIEQITSQLGKYGKIEGKNVFYWFQNHKARLRQKLKRHSLRLAHSPGTPMAISSTTSLEDQEFDEGPLKRKRNTKSFIERLECDKRITLEDGVGIAVSTKFEALSDRLFGLIDKPSSDGGDETLELFPLHPEGRS